MPTFIYILAIGILVAIVFLSGWFFREIKQALVTKNGLIVLVLLFGLLMLATGILIGTTSSTNSVKDNKVTSTNESPAPKEKKSDSKNTSQKTLSPEKETTSKSSS